jgi:hypothetical protein
MGHGLPRVSLGGQSVNVLEASDREILIAPEAHQFSGTLSIETAPGQVAEMKIDLPPGSVRKKEFPKEAAATNGDEGGVS